MDKCRFYAHGKEITFKPDGVNELDPCEYKEVRVLRNVTVRILKCVNCGYEQTEWERQEDTEEVTPPWK